MTYELEKITWTQATPRVRGLPAKPYRVGDKQLLIEHDFDGLIIPTHEMYQPRICAAIEQELKAAGIQTGRPLGFNLESAASGKKEAHWRMTFSIWTPAEENEPAQPHSNL